jgi:hypothetical protein
MESVARGVHGHETVALFDPLHETFLVRKRKVAGGIEIIAGHPAKIKPRDYDVGEESVSVSVSSNAALNDRKSAFAELLKESARAPEFKRQSVPEFAAAPAQDPRAQDP